MYLDAAKKQEIFGKYNLYAGYDGYNILQDVSLQIPEGKITMMIGPNGCGKSTLLKTMAGIITPQKGEVLLNGVSLKGMKRRQVAKRLALLPQSPLVPEGLRVRELVQYGRFPYQKAMRSLNRQDLEIVAWAMKKTGVLVHADAYVNELSGGQRQRVWIAMALAQKTGILLLDEPTTYLDIAHQLEILELLRDLNREEQTTIILVIHDLNQAAKFADHVIGMKQGRALYCGKAQEVIREQQLLQLYDIHAKIVQDEEHGYPICMDYALHKHTDIPEH